LGIGDWGFGVVGGGVGGGGPNTQPKHPQTKPKKKIK